MHCEHANVLGTVYVRLCPGVDVCCSSSSPHLILPHTPPHLTPPPHLSTTLIDPPTSACGDVETRGRTPPISLLHKYRHDPAARHGTCPNMFLPTPRPRFTRRLNRSIKPRETPNATPRHATPAPTRFRCAENRILRVTDYHCKGVDTSPF
jgi:hypothetical protein